MKKFAFALDKVLDYKGQVENSLRSEYAQKMAKVKKQEVYIDSLISQFAGCRNEFEARKKQGCTVNLMVSYDGYLNSLRKQIEKRKTGFDRTENRRREKKRRNGCGQGGDFIL